MRDTRPTGEFVARTLLITDIPKQDCTVENLTEYFKYVGMDIGLVTSLIVNSPLANIFCRH